MNLVNGDPTASQYFTASLADQPATTAPARWARCRPARHAGRRRRGHIDRQDTNPIEVQGISRPSIQLATPCKPATRPGSKTRSACSTSSSNTLVDHAEAEIGVQLQDIDSLQTQNQSDQVQLQTVKSNDLDVDMTQAITNLLSLQTSFQASLQIAGMISQALAAELSVSAVAVRSVASGTAPACR